MKENNCLRNLLKFICLLQDNSTNHLCQRNCEKPVLGPMYSSCYDTRVVSFYQRDGHLFSITIDDNTYSYFRIMNVHNACCQLLILQRENNIYSSTNQFITLDIHCIGAICCIQDINL